MTSRLQLLDMIGSFLTEKLGQEKVTQRTDGILIVAGTAEAFAVQALTIDAPDGVASADFGIELVQHIERSTIPPGADEQDCDGLTFYTSENGDRWLRVIDVGGRQFIRHVPAPSSGGEVEFIDLQSFRDREPHSPQNQALEALLAANPV